MSHEGFRATSLQLCVGEISLVLGRHIQRVLYLIVEAERHNISQDGNYSCSGEQFCPWAPPGQSPFCSFQGCNTVFLLPTLLEAVDARGSDPGLSHGGASTGANRKG